MRAVCRLIAVIACMLMATFFMSACTQMPTEKQTVSDIRPQISFKTFDERLKGATVMLDGLNMGPVGSYIDGVAGLRILPGTHLLTIVQGNQIVFEEKFYAGDGAARSFVLN